MFWLDEELCSDLYLDGIVTVVDSKFCRKQIKKEETQNNKDSTTTSSNNDESVDVGKDNVSDSSVTGTGGVDTGENGVSGYNDHLNSGENDDNNSGTRFEFCNQIALADVLLLNKIDLVDETIIQDTMHSIRSINATSCIYKTSYGKIALEQILDIHAYDTGRLDFNEDNHGENRSGQFDKIQKNNDNNRNGHLDNTISTCTFQFEGLLDENDLDRVLETLLWSNDDLNSGTLVLRLKAVVNLSHDPGASYQVQAVYDIFDKYRLPDREALNKVIVIGHNLQASDIESKFKAIANPL